MKKAVTALFLMCFVLNMFAQNTSDNTLKFLGIPIDGSEQAMKTKLMQKGFREKYGYDCLTGQFNGKTVDVYIHTNHQKVDRIYIEFPKVSGKEIRNEFNVLLHQFKNNNKYSEYLINNQQIPEDEDILYEISVHNKVYEAQFRYIDPEIGWNEEEFKEIFYSSCSSIMPENEILDFRSRLAKYSEEQKAMCFLEFSKKIPKLLEEIQPGLLDELVLQVGKFLSVVKSCANGQVWFKIQQEGQQFFIALYYDNLANRPNGEDL